MIKKFTFLSSVFLASMLLIACDSANNETSADAENDENIAFSKESESEKSESRTEDTAHLAEKWLVSTIENYFHPTDGEHMDISSFSTDEYAEFKQDAMNLNNPVEFSEQEFREKWKHKNLDLIGIQNGFMISAQDYHTIKVTESKLKNQINEHTWLFEVVVEDIVYKGKYWREVLVSKAGNSFIIEDVMETKEEMPQ